MQHYPVFLDLRGTLCLVVGAGVVGRRRAAGLLEAGAREVRLVDPLLPLAADKIAQDATLAKLLSHPALRPLRRPFADRDVEGCRLVCAATDAPEVNAAVAAACHAANVVCAIADAPESGSCLIPASITQGGVHVALTTGGNSPALSTRIKKELDAWLTGRYDRQLTLLARVRPLIMSRLPDQAQRAEVLRQLAGIELETALRADDADSCAQLLRVALPAPLHAHIAELLHELA